jgi:hypothetical protein
LLKWICLISLNFEQVYEYYIEIVWDTTTLITISLRRTHVSVYMVLRGAIKVKKEKKKRAIKFDY